MNQRTYALIGAALALTAYVLAGTVLAGTSAQGPVMLIGGVVAGWLGLPQPRSR
jgi:hypothetical protein